MQQRNREVLTFDGGRGSQGLRLYDKNTPHRQVTHYTEIHAMKKGSPGTGFYDFDQEMVIKLDVFQINRRKSP